MWRNTIACLKKIFFNLEKLNVRVKSEIILLCIFIFWSCPLMGHTGSIYFYLFFFDRWDKQELHRYDLLEFLTGHQLTHHCLQTQSLASSHSLLWPECLACLSQESALPALGSLWPMDPFLQAMFPVAHQERWEVQTLFW